MGRCDEFVTVRKGRESSLPLFSMLSSPPALFPPRSLRRLIQYLLTDRVSQAHHGKGRIDRYTYEARIARAASKAPPRPAVNPMISFLLESESPLKPSSALLMALLIPLATLSVPLAVVGGTYEAGVPLEAETELAPVPNVFGDTLVFVVAGNVRSTPEGTKEV